MKTFQWLLFCIALTFMGVSVVMAAKVVGGILLGAAMAPPKVIEVPVAPHTFKTYVVSFSDPTVKEFTIPADSIERRDGCVLFWRGTVLDTAICPAAMDRLIVSEKN